ncbi:MAG: hypothetical protein K0A90_03975, partial [Methanosarcinaceae archaeon]|nr:hypothetical protein [Methanosarcinaceae archaeon]
LIIVVMLAIIIVDANNISDNEPTLEDFEKMAFKYYVNTYGDSDVTINGIDFGCHMEFEVIKDGNVIMTLEYSNGGFFEKL